MTQINLTRPDLLRDACYIGGEWVGAGNGPSIPVSNPSTGKTIVSVPKFGRKETEAAIASAEAALPAWSAKTGKERAAILLKWSQLMMQHQKDLAAIMTSEQGKPVTEAAGEIAYAASFLEWFAEEAKRIDGDVLQSPKAGQRLLALKQPIGVTAAITPWNFPAAMITRKAGPALAAGCTMVLKPAQQTPLTALALAVLAEEAGVPAGVFHVVTGSSREIGAALCESDAVRKLSFTGSTEVGRTLMEQCAPTIKKLSLELGGNAPFIVFDDADLDRAVDGILASKFRNAGQTCVCANRIYIQAGVYEEVTKRLVAKVQAMKVGDGFGEGRDARSADRRQRRREGAGAHRRRHRARRQGHRRRQAPRAGRHLLRAHRGARRDQVHALRHRGNLRPGRATVPLRDRAGSHRTGQRHHLRPGRVLLHPRLRPRLARVRGAGIRHRRHQHGSDLQRSRPVRRRQAIRPGP